MPNNYVYQFGDSLYINLTNRCPNSCDFCIRRIKSGVSGHELWLDKEPTLEELRAALEKEDIAKYKEVVFCGFGEPMCRLDLILGAAEYLKRQGATIRINTNGLGDLINGRDTVSLLKGYVDHFSISLNASTAEGYQKICHSRFGEVDCIGIEEIEKCRAIVESTGAHFRVRTTINADTEY